MEGFKKFLVEIRGYSEEEADKLIATLNKDKRKKIWHGCFSSSNNL